MLPKGTIGLTDPEYYQKRLAQAYTKADEILPLLNLAYCAGIVDGEGSIFILRRKTKKGNDYFVPLLAVGMTDKSPLDILNTMLVGKIEPLARPEKTQKGTTRKPAWRFYSRGEGLIITLQRLLPYLILKKSQAELAIEFYSLPRWSRDKNVTARKSEICNKMKELNK